MTRRRTPNALWVVLAKEARDNFRDRRTLFSALLFGPLFGPLLFTVLMTLSVERTVGDLDTPVALHVSGMELAPNLVQFLREQSVRISPGPATLEAARTAVANGTLDLVLVVPAEYPRELGAGQPAPLDLIWDSSNSRVARDAARIQALLQAYGSRLAALRLQARGVSPGTLLPIAVRAVDVSTPAGRSVLMLGMVTYLVLFATLMGGLYLAIDATAGERERGSLEALLTLPVPRGTLIMGKILATCLFMLVSLVLTVLAFTISLRWVPLESLGMSANFGIDVAARVILVTLPFVPFGAALMTVVASFTRSYKEAQTWVALILLVPTLPILFAGLYSLRPTLGLMMLPSLSQHLLITQLLRGETLAPLSVGLSAASSLMLAMLAGVWATRLYRRETILG